MDILDNARTVLDYTKGMDHAGYAANRMVRDASERCLARISEAAVKLGASAPELVPGQDWANIRGIGNLLRHEYDQLDDLRIWKIIDVSLEPLISDIENAMRQHGVPEE